MQENIDNYSYLNLSHTKLLFLHFHLYLRKLYAGFEEVIRFVHGCMSE